MSYAKSFRNIPAGTVSISATETTGNVAVTKARDLLLHNSDSSNYVYCEFGKDSTVTATTAGLPIPPGSSMIVSGEGVTYVAAICANGKTATLYVTPGQGI